MIDPKKIEEWRNYATPPLDELRFIPRAKVLAEAVPALLAERELLIRERDEATKLAAFPGWKVEYLAKKEAEREAMIALLREVEWRGFSPDVGDACPVCGGARQLPRRSQNLPPQGHRGDCRLAALIG